MPVSDQDQDICAVSQFVHNLLQHMSMVIYGGSEVTLPVQFLWRSAWDLNGLPPPKTLFHLVDHFQMMFALESMNQRWNHLTMAFLLLVSTQTHSFLVTHFIVLPCWTTIHKMVPPLLVLVAKWIVFGLCHHDVMWRDLTWLAYTSFALTSSAPLHAMEQPTMAYGFFKCWPAMLCWNPNGSCHVTLYFWLVSVVSECFSLSMTSCAVLSLCHLGNTITTTITGHVMRILASLGCFVLCFLWPILAVDQFYRVESI